MFADLSNDDSGMSLNPPIDDNSSDEQIDNLISRQGKSNVTGNLFYFFSTGHKNTLFYILIKKDLTISVDNLKFI